MSEEANSGAVAVEEPELAAEAPKKKKQNDDLEYEVEFATPFGKLEFEFEPLTKKKKKDRERKEKAEREAAQKAAKAAERAVADVRERGGRGLFGTLLIIFLVLAAIGAIIALAYGLFARPGEDDDEAVPPEFAQEPQPVAQGLVGRARGRLREAVRAGRQASRDAQREQRQKFEEMSRTAEPPL